MKIGIANIFCGVCILTFVVTTFGSHIRTLRKTSPGSGACPKDDKSELRHRLGKSRFYTLGTKSVDWVNAHALCKTKGLRMAALLDKVTTNALIARHLERLTKYHQFRETTYWISARHNARAEMYDWFPDYPNEKTPSPVKYSNFHYIEPRPVGIGAHRGTSNSKKVFGSKEIYDVKSNELQCIAFTLPYVSESNQKRQTLGWQASWIERPCVGSTHRRALCESTNPTCEEIKSRDPHVLTEDQEYYYTEGNWIFANRRFVVNWKPRTVNESKEYCEKIGLELYTPIASDDCLIPYLKLWAPVISTYHFWTSYKFDVKPGVETYYDKNGKVIQKGSYLKHDFVSRTNRGDRHTCVSYMWANEFSNETMCKDYGCKWMYYVLTPANCNNHHGTVCQHPQRDNTRTCNFKKEWLRNHEQAVQSTAVVEFGYKGSGFWRSTYKQTFGSRICGNDRQMLDDKTEYWKVGSSNIEFQYDYEETYWVIDDSLFANEDNDAELCTVSKLRASGSGGNISYQRELKKVNCLEWHFYLCESVL